jgi:hypothetical protein
MSATSPPRQYIEFYRLDLSRATRSILIPAAALITFGSGFLCVAAARIVLHTDIPRDTIGFFGGVCVLSGLVFGFGGMGKLLSREGFVGVTREGVHVRAESRDEFVPWDEVSSVRGDTPVELVLRDERAVPLPDVTAPRGVVVRDRLEELRRKASFNLLAK